MCAVSRDFSRYWVRWDASLKKGDIESFGGIFKAQAFPNPSARKWWPGPLGHTAFLWELMLGGNR